MIPTKEIALIEKEIKTLPATPTITNQNELESAALVLTRIKGIAKTIEARKKEIVAPLMASLASVRDLFRKHEESLKNSEIMFKTAILMYTNKQAAIAEKERTRILARAEKGTYKTETAVAKLDAIEETPKAKGIQTRTLTKVRVVDLDAIPREWLIPDLPRITEAVLRTGIEIAGVEKYTEKIIAGAR
jgi:hypothetical protein